MRSDEESETAALLDPPHLIVSGAECNEAPYSLLQRAKTDSSAAGSTTCKRTSVGS